MNSRTTIIAGASTAGVRRLYWVCTIFATLTFAAIGVASLVQMPPIIRGLLRLGYPGYLATILGIWELLGSIAVLLPGLPRLKEWAYAGMFFTLSGATVSHAIAGDSPEHILAPIVLLVPVMTSWVLQSVREGGWRQPANR